MQRKTNREQLKTIELHATDQKKQFQEEKNTVLLFKIGVPKSTKNTKSTKTYCKGLLIEDNTTPLQRKRTALNISTLLFH